MDLPTRLDLFARGRAYVRAHATKIDPAQVDVEGSDANLYVGWSSELGAHLLRQLVAVYGASLLDGNDGGEDLDRLVQDRYRLPRKGAAAAVGTARFFRPTAAGGSGSIAAGTRLFTLGGVEYVTRTTADFGPATLEARAEIAATQAGKEFQVGRNQVRRFAVPSAIFDPSIALTNDEPTAHGEPPESDDDYRERARAFWLSARRGTKNAIELGARAVPGIQSASAEEALDQEGRSARYVRLCVADGSGVASAAKAREVQAELLEWRACGIFVGIDASLPTIVELKFRLRFAAGTSETSRLAENVRAAAVEFVNTLGAGSSLRRYALGAVLQRFRRQGLLVDDETIVEPAGDVVPAPGRTLRTRPSSVSFA